MSSTGGKEERRRVGEGERVVRRICGHGLLRGFHIKRKWHYPRTYCCADFSFYYGRNAADAHKKRVSSRSPSRSRRRRTRPRPSFRPSSSVNTFVSVCVIHQGELRAGGWWVRDGRICCLSHHCSPGGCNLCACPLKIHTHRTRRWRSLLR